MKEGNQPFNAQKALRVACLVLADLILINLSAFLALYIRFEFDLKLLCETEFLHNMIVYSGINSVCTILIFYILKLYNSLWEFAGVSELVRTAVGCFFSAVFYMVGMFMLHLTVPRSFPAIYMLVLCLLCGALRFAYRCARRTRVGLHSQGGKRTMLIGGGQAGAIVLREFQTSPRSENKVVCIIDDSPDKVGSYLRGVKIVGGRSSIPAMAEKYDIDEIVLAIPSASRQEKLQILSYCHDTSCALRTLPGICQLANGEVRIEQIREVDIEDLLGRETVKIDLDEVAAYITGKTVLVTGGGGSIGSELCRQAAAQRPKRLIIFDIYENNAYDIQMELQRTHPELDLVVLIGSVRDRERVMQVFDRYRPDLVCHAAAHKHVPLMETSPFEAIKNNVFGTYNVAQAADRFGTQRFILISTDKAVNPTNVMRIQAPVRDDRADDQRPLGNGVCRRALRQRPRLGRQRYPALSQADPQRRPRHGHGQARHPLFHDHSRGRAAHFPGGRVCPRRRDLRARHGRARVHRRSGTQYDPAVRFRAGCRYSH